MHVLIIPAEHFVTDRMPLGGVFQLHQAMALEASGLKVGVINAGVISPRFLFRRYPYRDVEKIGQVPVYRRFQRRLWLQRFSPPERAVRTHVELGVDLFAQYCREHGMPDVLHAHDVLLTGSLALELRRRHRIPYILTEHSSVLFHRQLRGYRLRAARESVREAATTTAVSTALGQVLQHQLRIDGLSVELLPNVLDKDFIDAGLSVHERGQGPTILTVGSLDANKDQATLIQAFAASFRGRAGASLRIAGSGPFRRRLEKLSEILGVKEQVRFLGQLGREMVLREMLMANCFVLSSRVETFGVVLIEALACGLPVVSTRCGGPQDIVHKDNGLLVDPGDATSLAAAMEEMIALSDDYRPEELREDCLRRFGPEAFAARAKSLFERAAR